jgi:O-succinylbenzoate synthase
MRAAAARPRARRGPWHRAGRMSLVAWCVVHRHSRMHSRWFSTRLSVCIYSKKKRGPFLISPAPALSSETWPDLDRHLFVLIDLLLEGQNKRYPVRFAEI